MLPLAVKKELAGLQEGLMFRDAWRSVTTMCGAQCVSILGAGMKTTTLEFSAKSWGFLVHVRVMLLNNMRLSIEYELVIKDSLTN